MSAEYYCCLFWCRSMISVVLCRTNLLTSQDDNDFKTYFSETSYPKTLRKFMTSGEYNKTKKRKTPMYCFGSTITCTQFPKFFQDGRPQILPRPYYTSKPGNHGYNLIRTDWMQSFIKEVERHVLHYLHNICPNKEMKKLLCSTLNYPKKSSPSVYV